MLSFPIQHAAPALQGKPPEELPHGLVVPPPKVRELVAWEKAKHPSECFSTATEEAVLNDWTIDWFFNGLGHEVLYRQTPGGPEILAVGFDEIYALTDGMKPEKMTGLKTWVP